MTVVKRAARLNPRIEEVAIGIRDLKRIKVYPLSVGHEMQVSDLVSETLSELFSKKVEDINREIISLVINTVKGNIKTILELVLDLDNLKEQGFDDFEAVLLDMDNDQIVDLAEIIYKNNFQRLAKKLKGSLGVMLDTILGNIEPSREPSLKSATSTQDTDSSISTEESTKKEE